MMKKYIIAGLGNPGSKYLKTKHNVGAEILDIVANNEKESWKEFKKCGHVVTFKKNGSVYFLYKPQEFMNLSGKSILEFMDYFDIATENLMIVHDEMGLHLATVKYSIGGGHNSHNGVANVIQMMQSKDFMRIKFGIGRPFDPSKKEVYALTPFPKAGSTKVSASMRKVAKNIELFINGKEFDQIQNDNNGEK